MCHKALVATSTRTICVILLMLVSACTPTSSDSAQQPTVVTTEELSSETESVAEPAQERTAESTNPQEAESPLEGDNSRVKGRIFLADTEVPVPEMRVEILESQDGQVGDLVAETTTDTEGNFSVDVSAATYILRATWEGSSVSEWICTSPPEQGMDNIGYYAVPPDDEIMLIYGQPSATLWHVVALVDITLKTGQILEVTLDINC